MQKNGIVEIGQLPFVNTTMDAFIKNKMKPYFMENKRCFIVTANPEILMYSKKDPVYKKNVLQADFIVPDGIGIIFAAKYKRTPLQERIAGFDLMQQMLQMANEKQAACYFLGASEASNQAAVDKIRELYPNIRIAGHHHGYFQIDDEDVAAEVAQSEADFIFVALGFPKQEQWIEQHKALFSKGIFMGVGGSLDVFAGTVKRAPDFWISWNLEWLYRLLQQPFRFKRMFPIVKFMWLVIRGKL